MKSRLASAILIGMVLMTNQALAFSFSEYYGEQMRKHAAEASTILEQIQSSDEQTIPDPLLHSYYVEACWMVYNGLLVYMHETDTIPEDLSVLADSGYVTFWPVDPVTGTEMGMSGINDPQPGTFVVQLCPPSHYSIVGTIDNFRLVPLSFELSVIGQNEMGGLNYTPNELNNWAQVPSSAIFQVGSYTEVAEITLREMVDNMQEMRELDTLEDN